ncbi:hypothetical protein FQR65_LT05361 [Abscondita terminalis]|nr:hypothetical protein FQR65_LT05361 [Abscondita terminalis]
MSGEMQVIESDSPVGKLFYRSYLGEKYAEFGPGKQVIVKPFTEFYDRIANFEIRDEDVFILAYPKTGSRWTQEMVWLILNGLDYTRALDEPQHDRSPLLEIEAIYPAVPENRTLKAFDKAKNPRCYKSHLQWSLLPKDITSGVKQPKIIVVLRGPEDVCTSNYYQAKVTDDFQGNWDDFCTLFLAGKIFWGPYWNHVLGLWEQRHRSNFLFIKYNKMKTDLSGTVQQVATFLGKRLSSDQIKDLCEHLSFNNLKKSKGFNMDKLVKGDINPFIRKGNIGDHKNVMSDEVIEEFRKQKEMYLSGTDLSFE